jgi:homoserine O-succinyltransferase
VEVTLIHPETHQSKNTSAEHLTTFYKTFSDIKHQRYDGLVITGAPVEHLPFQDVTYWTELTEIMNWAKQNVTSTMYICWAAQAGLHHHFGIQKYPMPAKIFGVFPHTLLKSNVQLVRGFDEIFYAPQSRHTDIHLEDLLQVAEVEVLSVSEEAGVYLAISKDGKHVFVTGHSEYDADTLKWEYERDVNKGLDIAVPKNYYPEDDPTREPRSRWKAHANLLFSNWLNYYVYQETPYELGQAKSLI